MSINNKKINERKNKWNTQVGVHSSNDGEIPQTPDGYCGSDKIIKVDISVNK